VEAMLAMIFKVASRWKAVLLIDEADRPVLLERSKNKIPPSKRAKYYRGHSGDNQGGQPPCSNYLGATPQSVRIQQLYDKESVVANTSCEGHGTGS